VDGDDPDNYLANTIVRWYNWTGSIWNLIASTDGNSALLEAGNTTKGESWRYELEVYDGTVYSSIYISANTTILNTAPTATSLTLTPTNPSTSSDLVADWSFVDADNSDTQVTNYTEWYRGIIHQPIYDGLTILPSSATTKNQVWYFKVIVNDGETNSTTYISAGVEILNTPPQATAVTLTPSTPNTSVNLIADWGFQDNDSIDSQSAQYIVRWYKDGVIQSAYNDETTVFSTTTSKDEKWNFTVKVHDGTNYSIQYNSSIVTIINSAPTASSLTITTNPTTTDNLVASWSAADIDGDDPDNYLTDAILRWYNDTGSSWQLIATTNGNSPVLEAGNTSKGETWRYELEVYDGTAYSSIYT
jgi:hypothetical protein